MKRAPLLRAALRLSPLLVGWLLHPAALDPDAPLPLAALAGCFLIFVSMVLAAEGLGRGALRFRPFHDAPLGIRLAVGSGLIALATSLAAQCGMIGERMRWLFFAATAAALLLGGLLPERSSDRRSVRDWLAGTRLERALLGIVTLVAFVFAANLVLEALLPVMRPDPLYYHLVGPRHWFEKGIVDVLPGDPVVLFCSYWEDLALWGVHLLGGSGGKGLIECHLLAQWIHLGIGFLGTASVLDALVFRFIETRRASSAALRALALLAALTLSFVSWTASTAKNDWGIVLWTLGAAWMLQAAARERSVRALPWAGALAGLAFAAKFSAGPMVLPLALWGATLAISIPVGLRKKWVALAGFAAACLCAALPILVRNARLTGNPFFPTQDIWFHSRWLSESARDALAMWEGYGASRWELLLAKIPFLVAGAPLLLVGLPALAVVAVKERRRFVTLEHGFVGAALAGSALYLVTLGSPPSGSVTGTALLRLAAPALVPCLALSVMALARLVGERRLLAPAVQIGILLLVVWPWDPPRIDRSAARFVANAGSLDVWIRERQPGGLAKAWLRTNVHDRARDRIVVAGDEQVYYLLPLEISLVYTDPALEPVVKYETDPVVLTSTLVSAGFRYFLDTRKRDGSYWTHPASVLAPYAARYPASIVFAAPGQTVVDLPRLQELARP